MTEFHGKFMIELQDSPEELGYVSDVCDYNVQDYSDTKLTPSKQGEGSPAADVVHGLLSLSIASQDRAIKVDKTVVKNDHVNARKAHSDIEQMDQSNSKTFNIVRPFPEGSEAKQKHSEDEPDSHSQYSRQSSVEDSKSESKSKRKSCEKMHHQTDSILSDPPVFIVGVDRELGGADDGAASPKVIGPLQLRIALQDIG